LLRFEEDFVAFNDCNKDTVHEVASVFEILGHSNPECEASWVNVEEWIDASKGIVLSHTIAGNENLINVVVNPHSESKNSLNLEMKKSSQRKILGLKLLTYSTLLKFAKCWTLPSIRIMQLHI
jgi:hypothetical protein